MLPLKLFIQLFSNGRNSTHDLSFMSTANAVYGTISMNFSRFFLASFRHQRASSYLNNLLWVREAAKLRNHSIIAGRYSTASVNDTS